jgi:ribosomal protein S18 acetylase RimI-like enzyme
MSSKETGDAPRIQVASRDDLEALTRLAAAFRDSLERSTPSDEEFRQSIAALLRDQATEFFLAVGEDGQGIGYIQQRYRYSAWLSALEAYLEDLFVKPEARGHGVGSSLVEFAVARAREKGCRLIGLNTNEQNNAAVALYRHLDFSCERNRWGEGRQLWFEKSLKT